MHTLNELNSWVCQSNDPNNNQQAALHSQLSTQLTSQLNSQLNPNTGGILLSNTVELVTGGEDLVASNLLNGQQPQMSIQCTVSGETDLVQNTGGKIFGSNRGLSFVKYPSNQQFPASNLSNGHLNAHGNPAGNLGAGALLNQQANSAATFSNYSLSHQSMNSLAGSVSNGSNNSNSSTLSSSSSNNSLAYSSLNLSQNSSSGGASPSTTIGQQQQQLTSAGLTGQYANGYGHYSSFDQLMATHSIPTPSPEQQWLPNSPQHSPDQHLAHQTALHPHHHGPIAHSFTSQQHSPQHHVNLPTPPSLTSHHTQRDLTANQFQPQQTNRRLNDRHFNGHYNGYNSFNQTQQRQQVGVLFIYNLDF